MSSYEPQSSAFEPQSSQPESAPNGPSSYPPPPAAQPWSGQNVPPAGNYPPNQGAYPPPAGFGQGGYPPPGAYPQGAYPAAPYGASPGAPYGVDMYGQPLSDKSKLVGGLLNIFLGSFGVGRFYLGYTNIAIAQIAVTWLTCGIGGIWPLVDGIMILMGKVPDSRGLTLRD